MTHLKVYSRKLEIKSQFIITEVSQLAEIFRQIFFFRSGIAQVIEPFFVIGAHRHAAFRRFEPD